MGYHVINISNGVLQHDYVEDYVELSYIDFITKDSIIYQGESHWKPFKVSESAKYKQFSEGWYRAGIQAQEVFKEQAMSSGLILEELNQDQKSFKLYTRNAEKTIKRGDFLIRNYANIEVDVKCRGFYKRKDGQYYFDFTCEDVEKHLNMQSFTNTPIIIAVYQNAGNKPVENQVYFFSIDDLKASSVSTYYRKGIDKQCYEIPLSFTHEGFSYIDKIYKSHIGVKDKSYTLEEKRLVHKRAYAKWEAKDDEKLEVLYCEGKSVKELSVIFERNGGAIRSRIRKLELDIKYDR
ncbi:hypothetical protein [Aquimarina agarivorans]|uniref:hypothetical protein n=1 Tax=Aquimarina agarivorans TaxID=980584 RepID=UPI000248EAA8|nr:hypothetical protein [Aquimarina agarivorans]